MTENTNNQNGQQTQSEGNKNFSDNPFGYLKTQAKAASSSFIEKVEPLKIDSVDDPEKQNVNQEFYEKNKDKTKTPRQSGIDKIKADLERLEEENPEEKKIEPLVSDISKEANKPKIEIPKEILANQEFHKVDSNQEKNPFLEIQKGSRETHEEEPEGKGEVLSLQEIQKRQQIEKEALEILNEDKKVEREDNLEISSDLNLEDKNQNNINKNVELEIKNPEKTEIKIEETKSETVSENNAPEKVSEVKKAGFFGGLKAKWQNHVEKNKKNAEIRKNTKNSDSEMLKGDSKEKIKTVEEIKKSAEEIEEEDLELAELFENYNPKTDRKKLTPKLRQQIREAEKFYNDGVVNIKDLISPTSMVVTPKHLELNDLHVKSYYVYNYPRYLEANWLNQIINFDASLDISLFVYPTDSARMMRILRKKVTEMRASRHMRAEKGFTNDVALETALEDAEQLRVDLQRGKERLFQVGVYISVYGADKNKLEVVSKQVETILGGLLVLTRSGDFQTERCFNSTLPQCTDEIQVHRNMNTSPLSTTFPFVSNTLTSNEGILYGLNRHNNSLIIFDRFNLENANSVIFAKSGAGKSYTVKLEVLRSLMMGTDVIIIDPEKEYETLSNTIGGTYVNISLNSPHRVNPFDLPLPIESDNDQNTKSLLRENIITLSGLMNLMLGKLNPEESSIMDKALFQTYEIKGITEETKKPQDYEMPTMLDLKNVLDSMEGGKGLAMRLEKYTTGTFSGLFSKQTNVDMDSELLCFGIRDLEDMLRPIAMYILLNYIWNRVRSKLKKRMLVIDEAWNLVQYEDSGKFLHNLCKRSRKYYLGISTITQDVEDFLGSKWGKPIITNSSMQMLLRQSPTAVDKLKKIFYLTEQEKYLLLNSNVGQGLFFAGNQHVAIQIIASYGEHKIVTTNPKDILMKQEAEKKGLMEGDITE